MTHTKRQFTRLRLRHRKHARHRTRSSHGGGLGGAGIEYDLLFEDTFTDANGTDLLAHTPEMGSWVSGNSFEVQSNQCAPTGTAGVDLWEGAEDGRIDFTVTAVPAITAQVFPVFHYIDANNFISLSNFFGAWAFGETTGGASAQLVALVGAPTIGDQFSVRLGGGVVALYRNGVHVASLTNIAVAKRTETSMGFRNTGTGTTGRFDDYRGYSRAPFDPGPLPANTIDEFTVSGRNARMMYPTGWSEGPVVIYHHGAAEDETAPTADSLKAGVMSWLLANGFAVASLSTGTATGNPTSVGWYNDLWAELVSEYNPSSVVALAQSLGGFSSLNGIIEGTIPYTHWAGIYPSCDLAETYTHPLLAAIIDSGYGINGTPYATATDGSDPILEPNTAFTGIKMRYYASPSDTLVPKAPNSDDFAAHVNAVAVGNQVVRCYGDHGHPSHFIPDDLVDFFNS